MERKKLTLFELHIGDFVCYSPQNGYCTIVDQIRHTHDDSGDVIYFIDGLRDPRDPLNTGQMDSFHVDTLYTSNPIEFNPNESEGLLNEKSKEYQIVLKKISKFCNIVDLAGSKEFVRGGRFVIAELQNLIEKYGKAIPKKSLISFIEKF